LVLMIAILLVGRATVDCVAAGAPVAGAVAVGVGVGLGAAGCAAGR